MESISCKPITANMEFNVNVTFHVIILFTFLTAFYFLFVTKLTKDSFNHEIKTLIESNLGNAIDNIPEDQKEKISIVLSTVDIDKLLKRYEESDLYVKEHNKWIQNSAIATIIIGIITTVLVLYILYNNCGQCAPIWHIITENLITFTFVGLVEYLFFVNVAFKYVPAPPSLLVTSLINKFKSSLLTKS